MHSQKPVQLKLTCCKCGSLGQMATASFIPRVQVEVDLSRLIQAREIHSSTTSPFTIPAGSEKFLARPVAPHIARFLHRLHSSDSTAIGSLERSPSRTISLESS